ncbi:MAG: acetate/propionate family kinase [Christensenellales bacterium]|jgi:acetate kinase
MKNVLVINAGSSSLKYQLIEMSDETVIAKGLVERIGIDGSKLTHNPNGRQPIVTETEVPDHTTAIRMVLQQLTDEQHGVICSMDEIYAVGHRVVHGGESFKRSVIINDYVVSVIEENAPLAPLHNPANIMGITACREVLPNTTMVAVFDTAFHQTMPPCAYLYTLPYNYYTERKIRRYGFHGTSHQYVANRAAAMMCKPIEELNIITCHLGNGSSIAAVQSGKSIDTSMGFTPLAGVPMGTRTGDIDPAITFYLMKNYNMEEREINEVFNKKSGMEGLSGVSSDFRDLWVAADAGNEQAQQALEVFCYGVKKYIGSYSAAMNGVDCIVFTAGIGENDHMVRKNVLEGLDYLGVSIDEEKNKIRGQEIDISKQDSKVRVFVIPTNEELMIARETMRLAVGK